MTQQQRAPIPANMAIAMVFLKGVQNPLQLVCTPESAKAAQEAFIEFNSSGMFTREAGTITTFSLDAYVGDQPRKSVATFAMSQVTGLGIDTPSAIVRPQPSPFRNPLVPDLGSL